MTFLILAEIATFSYDGELTDVEFDVHEIEASNEMSARQGLALLIRQQGRQVGKMQIEGCCKGNLSDVMHDA